MPRFFIDGEPSADGVLEITGDDARHVARSLRMAVGDEVTLSNGKGLGYTCRLTEIRDEHCTCEIISEFEEKPRTRVTLFMAYPKGDKLETVVQKSVELGAALVQPFYSSRCIKRPQPDREARQTERLRRIAHEAAKQCGAAVLPEVLAPIGFEEMLRQAAEQDAALFCYENESTLALKDALTDKCRSIAVVVGSEGGFSPEEAERAHEAGLISVSLGRRILRCETAPLYALSVIDAVIGI